VLRNADPCLFLVRTRTRGSMSLTIGSGDPAIFVIDLQDANKKLFFYTFFCLFLFEGTFKSFFKDKKSKRSYLHNSRNQCFAYYFCLMIEGSGSVPLTNESGSRRLKNIPDPQHWKNNPRLLRGVMPCVNSVVDRQHLMAIRIRIRLSVSMPNRIRIRILA
jgi:hypothetical protein